VAEVWLTEKYYKEFHERKDSLFSDLEAIDVYKHAQITAWKKLSHYLGGFTLKKRRSFYGNACRKTKSL
jgi:hypothetical protein